ncbi:ABC transporter ATP-binding protein, partial [Candidatus Saccharibacteria bacterium]|nr:ABC transporter ATP-binding protein [Candidatus Saccharibacteria bacterium]
LPPLIDAKNLNKNFGKTCALNEISFQINEGELFGFVGPDGAGKTTTLRLLAGILDISSGTLVVDGVNMDKSAEALKPRIGYMAQQFSLYRELSVQENLQFFAQIFNVPKHLYIQRSENLLDFAGLSKFKDRRASKLSGGMQKKLALA